MIERRFDEREVALIFERAARMQAERERSAGAAGGWAPASLPPDSAPTQGELEQIASEAGIDPRLVRRAIVDLPHRPGGVHRRLLGAERGIVVERTVPGPTEQHPPERLLSLVRAATGDLGHVDPTGVGFGWRGSVEGARVQLWLEPDGGDSRLRLTMSLDPLAAGTHAAFGWLLGVGGGGVAFAAVIATAGTLPALAVGGGIVGAGHVLARVAFRRAAARYRVRAVEIADAVAAGMARAAEG